MVLPGKALATSSRAIEELSLRVRCEVTRNSLACLSLSKLASSLLDSALKTQRALTLPKELLLCA